MGVAVAALDLAALTALLAAASTARNKHDDGSDQGQDSGHKGEPRGRAVRGITDAVLVDLVAEEGEDDKVNDKGNGVDDEGHGGDERGQDGEDGATGDQAEDEGQEEGDGADGVEDEHAGQGLDGVGASSAEVTATNVLDNLGRVVANGRIGARPALGIVSILAPID